MITQHHETIAAIATPIGVGGISVIRISGADSFFLADRLFVGLQKVSDAASHTIHYGKILDPVSRETIDTVLVSVFRNPHSFTGEDVAEISSHGGYFIAQKILTLLYEGGARPAEPGEFTLRAFLNGKMDLTQAEAVADIVQAKSDKAHKASVAQLSGKLSKHVQKLREDILNLCSLLELDLDFSQEGIELAEKSLVVEKISKIQTSVNELILSYREGKVIKDGIKVVLVGKPNAGKSSLLNALLQEERAIVSEIAGTTRDVIEESIVLNGVEFIFNDTAGLRESADSVEIEGIKRAEKAVESSDLVLLLVDCSMLVSDSDRDFYSRTVKEGLSNKNVIWVFNKSDIANSGFNLTVANNPVLISCKTHHGIHDLKRRIVEVSIPHYDSSTSSITITNIRHKQALDKALDSLAAAKNSISSGLGGDFATVDLRSALNYLGEIIGLTTPDDILNNIFSNFCIGK